MSPRKAFVAVEMHDDDLANAAGDAVIDGAAADTPSHPTDSSRVAETAIGRDPTSSDRGAMAVIVAISMFLMLGVTATVVDLGYKRQLDNKIQSATDAAALAAVLDLASGNASTTAKSYLADNDITGASVAVNAPPLRGEHAGDAECIEVTATKDFDTFFGGVLGSDSLTVAGRSVACGNRLGDGFPALFAISEVCPRTIDLGADRAVIAGVHSNNDLFMPGANNDLRGGSTTYTTSLTLTAGGNSFMPGDPSRTTVKNPPFAFDLSDYAPGGAAATAAGSEYHDGGNATIDMRWLRDRGLFDESRLEIQPGIYYTTGNITITEGVSVAGGGGVTFVSADGVVGILGDGVSLDPYIPEGLLVFAARGIPSCDEVVVELRGNGSSWRGLVYAPNGRVSVDGNSTTTMEGAIVSYTISVLGERETLVHPGSAANYRAFAQLKE